VRSDRIPYPDRLIARAIEISSLASDMRPSNHTGILPNLCDFYFTSPASVCLLRAQDAGERSSLFVVERLVPLAVAKNREGQPGRGVIAAVRPMRIDADDSPFRGCAVLKFKAQVFEEHERLSSDFHFVQLASHDPKLAAENFGVMNGNKDGYNSGDRDHGRSSSRYKDVRLVPPIAFVALGALISGDRYFWGISLLASTHKSPARIALAGLGLIVGLCLVAHGTTGAINILAPVDRTRLDILQFDNLCSNCNQCSKRLAGKQA
jgi:hypothetical protein